MPSFPIPLSPVFLFLLSLATVFLFKIGLLIHNNLLSTMEDSILLRDVNSAINKIKYLVRSKQSTERGIKEPEKLLTIMENILDVIPDAESRQTVGVRVWLQNLQGVVSVLNDLLDEVPTADRGEGENIHEDARGEPSQTLLVIGRDKEKENIIEELMKNNSNDHALPVFAIVGAVGLGKTTLANSVFHDAKIRRHFGLLLWANVSFERFNLRKFVARILRMKDTYSLERLQKELPQRLNGKRFLLVLDGIRSMNLLQLDDLQELLINGIEGNKILATTRSDEVACRMDNLIELVPLSREDYSWEIFAESAGFHQDKQEKHPNLVQMGKELVKLCKGVPLALTILGGILNRSTDETTWIRVKDKIGQRTDFDIKDFLELSFDELSQRCGKKPSYENKSSDDAPKEYAAEDPVAPISDRDIRNMIDGIEEDVEKLNNTYDSFKTVLSEAQNRPMTEKDVRVLLEKMKDVSYEIEDALDVWNTVLLKVKIGSAENQKGSNSYRLSDCSWLKQLAQEGDFPRRIRELNEKSDDINKEKDAIKFNSESMVAAPPMPHRRESRSSLSLSTVRVRDLEIQRLVENLCNPSKEKGGHEVVSVVGMGGVGKTTLAQLVYNNATVRSHFQNRIWVCVSDPFDKVQVAKSIAKSLGGNPSDFTGSQGILKWVSSSIAEKRYLLVLDDVWTEHSSNWESLLNSLKSGSDGSKILLTTRNAKCAKAIGSTSVHPLGQLSAEESWKLFSQIAFFHKSEEDIENLKEIGQKIAEKCKGLPLALKAIARHLQFNRNPGREMQNVLESQIWELETAWEQIFESLLLSYYDLTSPIKKCFSLCGVFPNGYKFEVEELKRMWMSQGYLNTSRNEDMETVGEEYFEHLLTRSFFQDLEYQEDTGLVRYCKMHDIVHDFAQFLSKDESLVIDMENKKLNWSSSSCRKLRHLTVLNKKKSGVDVMSSSFSSSIQQRLHFYSLRISGRSDIGEIGKNFHNLSQNLCFIKALDLRDNGIVEVPEGIGQFVHLRYLDLSKNYELQRLPGTIYELCNLQTLLLKGCMALKELPEGIEKLINLRHLEFNSFTILPKGIGSVSTLRTLSQFIVGRDDGLGGVVAAAATIGDLINLNNLQGFLEINHLSNVKDWREARKAELWKKKGLTRLILSFEEGEGIGGHENEVIEALKPCHSVEILEIWYYSGKLLPSWISLLTNLRSLWLLDCYECEELSPLGQLPSLESLYIKEMSCKRIGEEFLGIGHGQTSTGEVAFPKLKELGFRDMTEWAEWEDHYYDDDDLNFRLFPCLEKLGIMFCPELRSLPQFISKSPIQTLEILYCPILEERCRPKTGEDWPKIFHIPNIRVDNGERSDEIFEDEENIQAVPIDQTKKITTSIKGPLEVAGVMESDQDEEMIESTSDAGLGTSNLPSSSSGPNEEGEMRIQSIPDPKSTALPSSSKGSLEFLSNSDFIAFRSRRPTMRLILKALRDESCDIVGVVGMGGVGKTAIVDDIAKKAPQLNFDRVVKVVVTQTPDVKRIQAEIAFVLNLRFHSEADELARADKLFRSLSGDLKSILVILDDIWSSKDSVGTNLLDAVGIPYGVQHGGCKIILTTRREAVCDDMGIKEEHRAKVDVLKDMESRDLFWKYAGLTIASYFLENPTVEEVIKQREAERDDMGIKEEHKAKVDVLTDMESRDSFWKYERRLTFASSPQNPTVNEVIKECYDLPIALVTMGDTLRGKELKSLRGKELKSWISEWSKLRQPQLEHAVCSCLKSSYDYIREKETKFCFLLCCLFPEDSDIPIEQLIRYMLGKGLFGDATALTEVRARVHGAMKELTGSYLLLKSMSNRSPCLKMHGLFRNFAMSIESEAEQIKFIEAGAGFEGWPENNLMIQFTCISLMENKNQKIPERLECPSLELLTLFRNTGIQNLPDSFFQGMTMLQVLDLSTWEDSWAVTIRLPKCLESIRTLLLDHRELEGNLSIIGKLVKLEILSLRGTNITELPVEIERLNRLRLLDLNDCKKLERIPANVISKLCSLEELYMKGGFRNWKVIEGGTTVSADHVRERNASLSEIQSLSSLTVFTAEVDYLNCLPSDFPFGNSTKFDLTVGAPGYPIKQVPSFSYSSSNGYIVYRTEIAISLLPKVEYLTLYYIEVTAILTDLDDEGGFNALKSLHLRECNGLEYLSDYKSKRSTNVVFANLEELRLGYLKSLKGFGEGVPSPESFKNLRILELYCCADVGVVIPSNWIRNLSKLEQLKVSECSRVTEIIEVAGTADEAEKTPPLANIKKLHLAVLRGLLKICKGSGKIISFSNLIELQITDCPKLASIFSPYMSQSLFHLQKLTVQQCPNLRVIFEEAEEGASMDEIHPLEFPKLKIVPVQGCEQLKIVSFKECRQLRSVFPVSIARRLVNLEELHISHCDNMVELVSCGKNTGTEREASSKEIQLPWLTEMEIEELSSLNRFCPIGYSLGLSSLEELKCVNCPELVELTSGNAASYGLIKIPNSARILNNTSARIPNYPTPGILGYLNPFRHYTRGRRGRRS